MRVVLLIILASISVAAQTSDEIAVSAGELTTQTPADTKLRQEPATPPLGVSMCIEWLIQYHSRRAQSVHLDWCRVSASLHSNAEQHR